MRRTGNATALLVAALLLTMAPADAQERERPAFTISIEPPSRVTLGDRGQLVVHVIVGPGAARPLLVTPTSEGPAIEIVQGRFTRADAEDPDDAVLRFEVPFVARTAGTSVVRVRASGFSCDDARCTAVEIEASRPVEVMAR